MLRLLLVELFLELLDLLEDLQALFKILVERLRVTHIVFIFKIGKTGGENGKKKAICSGVETSNANRRQAQNSNSAETGLAIRGKLSNQGRNLL